MLFISVGEVHAPTSVFTDQTTMASRTSACETGSYVCSACLRSNSTSIELITRKCFESESRTHAKEPRVQVYWSAKKCLIVVRHTDPTPIRPMPKVYFHGPFALCSGNPKCAGEKCTYPHSIEELQAWNRKKTGGIRHLSELYKSVMITGLSTPWLPPLPRSYLDP